MIAYFINNNNEWQKIYQRDVAVIGHWDNLEENSKERCKGISFKDSKGPKMGIPESTDTNSPGHLGGQELLVAMPTEAPTSPCGPRLSNKNQTSILQNLY